jgi:RNA polymerase primary sigma factor
VHVDERVGRLRRSQARLRAELGRDPSDAELAAELDLSIEQVACLKDSSRAIASLNSPVGDDGAELKDLLEDERAVDPGELAAETLGREVLGKVLGSLPERERQVLVLRFGLDSGSPRTLEQVGAVMGCSRERVCQLEGGALQALRHPETRARLEDLVPA